MSAENFADFAERMWAHTHPGEVQPEEFRRIVREMREVLARMETDHARQQELARKLHSLWYGDGPLSWGAT